MAIGQFGPALEEAMKRAGETRLKVAEVAHVDNSTIGKVIKGSRKPAKEVMSSTVEHYDDGQLYIAAAGEVTGGAFAPWLNNVDLHRACVLLKSIEEIQEVIAVSGQAPISKTNEQLDESERLQVKRLLMETVEAITALTHLAAVLCKEYSFSWLATWKEHRAILKAKKYMK
ncbi:helix-turn-helix domain-containing protein [Paenibacillus alvei]|uniref:helix-turn-helix domain-containing protein n=1 Tax=Paenibacillus alvei TaxID=44250 RepID=UPI00227FD1AA|nr:helix-turn-helix transcriptional regulator [Paenibacillus alvei]MCY9734672.1 helix-turn-helix domain-containing protein [Paenibacillus alvei]MCY9754006.1 helix-turn-helix domain-containing protein [Paenibacillus alvei]